MKKSTSIIFAVVLWLVYTVSAYATNMFIENDTLTFYRVAYSLVPLAITAVAGALAGISFGEDGWELLSLKKTRPSSALWAALLGVAFGLFEIGVFHFEYIASLFSSANRNWSMAGTYALYFAGSFGLVLAAVVLTAFVTSVKTRMVGNYAPWYVAVLVGAVTATGPFLSVGPFMWLALLGVMAWLLVWTKSVIPACTFGAAFSLVYLFLGLMGDFAPVETIPDYRALATVFIVLLCLLFAGLSFWKLSHKRG